MQLNENNNLKKKSNINDYRLTKLIWTYYLFDLVA